MVSCTPVPLSAGVFPLSNYDVGNRELLALVMALQKCYNRLEGAAEPFVVCTDFRNLAYLRGAKHLNSRHASWALFLGRCSPGASLIG